MVTSGMTSPAGDGVVRHVTVQAARVAPDARTPSGAGATERAHSARLHPPACPATAPLDRFVAASQ